MLKGQKTNADNWPLYGELSRDTMRMGGFAIYAHGGYSQAIHADFVQKRVSAVELLQFGVYRGIELAGWYDILNIGYRFPCVGASDYPACRKLGDCQTYVSQNDQAGFAGWLKAAAEGRSFVTTGPLLLLEVDGERPGGIIRLSGPGAHHVRVKVRVKSHVAPVQTVQVIVGGKVVFAQAVAPEDQTGRWIELDRTIDLDRSSWIAARAFGVTRTGAPDAEAHTNPVYVDIGDKAPYNRDSLDRLIAQLDGQMAAHRKRSFAEKARVLDYFQKSRDILLRIRQAGGLPAGGIPDPWIEDDPATAGIDPSLRVHQDEQLERFLEPLPARTYSGVIAAETATSLTLRRGEGAQDTILRGQVEELASTGMSLMPEGFEKRISKPEMADLIAFVCGAHRDGDSASRLDPDRSRPLDIGTLPGLIEPDE